MLGTAETAVRSGVRERFASSGGQSLEVCTLDTDRSPRVVFAKPIKINALLADLLSEFLCGIGRQRKAPRFTG